MIRAVVDTNILIRAVIRPLGTVGPIATRLRTGDYELVISEPLLGELTQKLRLPRIYAKYQLDDKDVEDFLAELVLQGEWGTPARQITACRDEDDNRVLESAVAGNADYIVTSDEDLIVLDPFEGIRIVRQSQVEGGSIASPCPRLRRDRD